MGQDYGNIQIINVNEFQIVGSFYLKHKGGIKDMCRTSRHMEFGLATLKGLVFVRISKDDKGRFQFQELPGEIYCKGYYVRNVIEYEPDEFLVNLNEDNLIYHIDRKSKYESDVCENP